MIPCKALVNADSKWTPEHGRALVDALIAGVIPQEFRHTLSSTKAVRVLDDPDVAFVMISEEGIQ